MVKLPKPKQINPRQPDTSTVEATLASLAKEIIELKRELNDQRKENKNFIHWVVGGIVAIVAVVAIEIILFHTHANKDFLDLQNQYFQEIQNLREKNFEMELRFQREIDALKPPPKDSPTN